MKIVEMPLSDIARELGVNKSRLLYYKRLNLIKPVRIFANSKQHTYDLNQVKHLLAFVDKRNYKKKGLTLAELPAHENI